MDKLTYQQVLADLYEETAPAVLLHQTEYEEEEIPPEDKHPEEIEKQEEFQKFGGDRAPVEYKPNPTNYDDKTKISVRYEKEVQTRVVSVDSRFRESQMMFATDYYHKLITPIKNVISVRLSSVEIPNTFYTFSQTRGNVFMRIYYPSGGSTYYDVVLPDGNYTPIMTGNPDDISFALQVAMNNPVDQFGSPTTLPFTAAVSIALNTSKMTISSGLSGPGFDIDWKIGPFSDRIHDWGLGYTLGYRNKRYVGLSSYTGEGIVDTVDGNYLFLGLDPDWKNVSHNHPDRTQFFPFAKIIINVAKFDVIYDNGSNTITKEYWFQQPINIAGFPVRLTDSYEQVIDLEGMNWSFTLEIKEALNPSVYEHIRELSNKGSSSSEHT